MARVTKKQVERAAADYGSAVRQWGEGGSNYERDRRLGKWQELQRAYETQTGRPMYKNPGKRGRTLLATQVEAIEYRHAWDGLPYRHDFDKAGTRAYLTRDGQVEIENKDLTLWEDYRGQPFLVNPPGRARAMANRRRTSRKKSNRPTARRKGKRSPPAGFRSWKAYMASIRPGASRRKRRTNPTEGGTVARSANPRKRRRRSGARSVARYARSRGRRRRNPPGGRLVGQVLDGVQGGAAVTLGKLAARLLPATIGLPVAGFAGIATQVGAGFGAAMATDRVLSRKLGPFVLAGAVSAVIESLLKKAAMPALTAALGDEGDLLAAYPIGLQLNAYPDFAAYPAAAYAQNQIGDTYESGM